MTKNEVQSFSVDVKESEAVTQLEKVKNPVLKKIIQQVLVEDEAGSSFGEGGA
jgi:hypothetical protein